MFFLNFHTVYAIERPEFDFHKYFFFITPFWGEGYNSNTIPFRIPQFQKNTTIHSAEKSFSGQGKGQGFEIFIFKKNWQFLFVHFYFPMYPNQDTISILNLWQNIQTQVTGNVLYIRYTWFPDKIITPFAGFSYFQGNGAHDTSTVKNFLLYSYTTHSYLHFPQVNVKVYVQDPNPIIGISYGLPIQHWKLEAIYSYGFEKVNTIIQTSSGNIFSNLNIFDIENTSRQLFQSYYLFNPDNGIMPTNFVIQKKYHSNRAGISLFMDYRRFISLRITLRRDLNFNRWITNAMFNLILSQHTGFTMFYEYSERSVGTIRYWLIGPTFVFQI